MRVRSQEYHDNKRVYEKERRLFAISNGICTNCFRVRAIPTRKQCQDCIDKKYAEYLLNKEAKNANCRRYMKAHPTYQRDYFKKHKEARMIYKREYNKGLRRRKRFTTIDPVVFLKGAVVCRQSSNS
jgi:hypothetical protein